MAPSLHTYPSLSFARPKSGERPPTRDENNAGLAIPSRTSSLHSRITQPIPSTLNVKVAARTPKTLTHAYLVCGVGREPSQWVKAPSPTQGKIQHMKGAVGQFWLPEILGSSPRIEQDNDIARALHAAMRACFPHDVEICTGRSQPHCVHHSFVLQQDSSHTLYGIALRVWSRADEKRAETIRDLRKRNETDFYDSENETYWIPYCLSFLSRYPLYDLLGDYLRGMWIHWNKATNLFHAEEVSRILSFPAPRLNDLVRIDMKDYALCYQFPSSPTGFQNFSMWPLFQCLSIPNIVGIIEAALSPSCRIILSSHYPAMLTVAAETIRYCVRVYEWSGLYVPVVHARNAKELVQEPGPYILGITAECRSLFTAPSDALVIDLDKNYVITPNPPTVLSSGQRNKFLNRISQALNGDVSIAGVPQHLRSAYGGGKLVPAGQIIVMRGEVESVQNPEWWNEDAVMAVMDHVCEKLGRNTGMKAIFGGAVKKPLMTKVSIRHLNEIVRERNQYSRDALEAWQDFIYLKGRMDTELTKMTKRNNFLVEELESWKQQFEKFQAFAAQLTKESQDLKSKIETHKRENRRLTSLIDQQKDDAARLSVRLNGTEKQRDDALEALVLQQEIAEELERERKKNKKELSTLQHTNKTILRQRDEAQRVVIHLRALIDGQSHHMSHIIQSLNEEGDLAEYISEGFEEISEDTEPGTGTETETDADSKAEVRTIKGVAGVNISSRSSSRAFSRNSFGKALEGEGVTPEMESKLLNSITANKRMSSTSVTDVADRYLRDKTDAIAAIIRNISEQCAMAVDGLQIVSDDSEAEDKEHSANVAPSEDGELELPEHEGSVVSTEDRNSLLSPRDTMSIPPTPELTHRSSTAMSISSSATVPERASQNFSDVPTKIVEDEAQDEFVDAQEHEDVHTEHPPMSKRRQEPLIHRPSGARISALGMQ